MNIRIFLLFILFISIISFSFTRKLTKVIEPFNNGEMEEHYFVDKDSLKQGEGIAYYKNGRIFYKTKYLNNKDIDSIYYYRNSKENELYMVKYYFFDESFYMKDYHPNLTLQQEGVFNKNEKRIGIWKNYDENGNLTFVKEYKIIGGNSYTNQMWEFLKSGDTLNVGTSMKLKTSPTNISFGDSIRIAIQGDLMQYPNKSDFVVHFPENYILKNYNRDFSNQKNVPIDTIYSLKYNNKYPNIKKNIDSTDHYKTVAFYVKPIKRGKDTLRGKFIELHSLIPGLPNLYEFLSEKELDSLNIGDEYALDGRTIYFDIPIEVTD